MMLTGKANEMLAPRSDTGAVSPAAPAAKASIRPSEKAAPPAFAGATLAGYPGQRGAVTVASMQMVGGVALAVGAADGHPAIWRRAASGAVDAGIAGHPERGRRPGEPGRGGVRPGGLGRGRYRLRWAGRRSRWSSPPPTA